MAPGWVRVEGSLILDAGSGQPPQRVDEHLIGVLLPGFIDVHSHGGGGASVIGSDPEQIATFVGAHRAHGTTTILGSLVSAAPDRLLADIVALAEPAATGLIAGIHLEGPWISPRFAGAHDRLVLRPPDPGEVAEVIAAGQGIIRMVTIAPELPGALRAVEQFVEAGAVVAVGHTDANYDQIRAAVDAGATVGTHLGNAMRGFHHRDPGPLAALTEDPRVRCELVLDGVHLHPGAAALFVRAASGGVLLVTDAMAAAAADDGNYLLGGRPVGVRDGVARLSGVGAIAGSTLTMDRAVGFAVQQVGMSLVQASRAASGRPAQVLGIDHRTGAIVRNLDADLVLLSEDFRASRVWHRGLEAP